MRYVGIDLHKRFLVACVQDGEGRTLASRRLDCCDTRRIARFFDGHRPFQAVIEASSSYRWLYDLLSPRGEVLLAHPLQLRAIVAGRAKTDKLDAALLAKLLRAGLIPESYVPPVSYQHLRELTRGRSRLVRQATAAKNEIHAMLSRHNVSAPFRTIFGPRGRKWLASLDLGLVDGFLLDELLRRLGHFDREVDELDDRLAAMSHRFPEAEALTCLYGIGLYSALLIIAEIGEPWRFNNGDQVGAYAGLTARVRQSGCRDYSGHITRQGSPWLRWILVQCAMKLVRRDRKLGNFYQRIRKRSGMKVGRVAAARKLAVICWLRLTRWHRTAAA